MARLTHGQMARYAVGDLGINLNFQLVGFFLAYFYTDVFGLSADHVAGLFLVARVWDAVNDPIMGYLADRTSTRWGQFRPFVLFGAPLLGAVLVACFFTPDFSPLVKVVYAYVTYILHGMVFTLVGLPYSSLSAVITEKAQERSVVSAYRMFFAVIVALSVVSIGVKPLVSRLGNEQNGFFIVAVVFGVATTLLLWFAMAGVRESSRISTDGGYKLSAFWSLAKQNDMLMILSLAMFLNTCVWVMGNAVAIYYFKYVLADESLVATFFIFMLPANVIGVVGAPLLTRFLGKTRTFMLGSGAAAGLLVVRHFLPAGNFSLFIAVSGLLSVALMFCSVTQWGMLPDTVEYGAWKSGVRSEGICFSLFSFTQKIGMAVGGSMAAFVLARAGYQAGEVFNQPEAALAAIGWLFNLVPAIFSASCLVVLIFYKLDGPFHQRIVAELASSRARS